MSRTILKCRVLNAAQQLLQQVPLDRLEGGAHNMRHKLAYRVMESSNVTEHGAVDFGALPEQSEVSTLQYISQIDDGLYVLVLHLLWQQQALGHNEIRVRQVRKTL